MRNTKDMKDMVTKARLAPPGMSDDPYEEHYTGNSLLDTSQFSKNFNTN